MARSKRFRLRAQYMRLPLAISDLSDIEDRDDNKFLIRVGVEAASNAINENIAMNIPVTFMQDGWVVSRMPEGHIERVVQIQVGAGRRRFAKGTVLHVKKSR